MPREAIIIGGPNGAGKSTLAHEYLQTYEFRYVSADLIAESLRPEQPHAARVQAGSAESFQEVAVGEGEDYEVTDEQLFELFLRDIN